MPRCDFRWAGRRNRTRVSFGTGLGWSRFSTGREGREILPMIPPISGARQPRGTATYRRCDFSPPLFPSIRKIGVSFKVASLPVDFHRAITRGEVRRGEARWDETRRDETRRGEAERDFDLNASSPSCYCARDATRLRHAIVLTIVKDKLNNSHG